ncbi:methyl-accepting chemotaxis protein [Asaia sp. VD9]|uniref:methyl-accepting chemotaxis protein n=1 Tax=Asaia sp. VD9 TaxID=3081235 RepID=UPI003016F383
MLDTRNGASSSARGVHERAIPALYMSDIVEDVPVLRANDIGATLNTLFTGQADLMMVAIVAEDGRPLGIIDRQFFFGVMSGRFGRALYTRRRVDLLVQSEPKIVEHDVAISDYTQFLLNADVNDLYQGFIVVRKGRYLGVGSTLSLVRAISRQSEESARYSKQTANDLRRVITTISSSVKTVHQVSASIREGSLALSGRTHRQTEDLTVTASSMREMNDAVQATAENVDAARHLVSDVNENAAAFRIVVGETVKAITEIATRYRDMVESLGLIEDISLQTRLLSFNAAVEAAHAGQEGKGFGVVADEIRALAHRSAEAAQVIATLVAESRERMTIGVRLAENVEHGLERIVRQVTSVDELIRDIRDTTQQQASNIGEINRNIKSIEEIAGDNMFMTAGVNETCLDLDNRIGSLNEFLKSFSPSGTEDASSGVDLEFS